MPTCQIAILAGGMGTRLRERTGEFIPKPMVPVLGKPLLEHQISLCRDQGFLDIAFLVHYQHEAISRYFGDGSAFGVRLSYLVEETPRGTAGALRDALPYLAPTFLVLYGDTFLDVDLTKVWRAHEASTAEGTLFLHPNDHPQDSDLVEVDRTGRILNIHPYPHPEGHTFRNLVNAGLYVFSKKNLGLVLPETGKADLAKHTFPAMLQAGLPLSAYISPEYIKDLGTPDRLDGVIAGINSGLAERRSGRNLRSAIFVDRDGTLNREVNHLSLVEQFELLPNVATAIQQINQSGYLAVGITNQPVLARGELSWEGLAAIHARLDALLGAGHAYLDAIYVCPHHPHRGFDGEIKELKMECTCRKPRTGMIDQACEDLFVSRERSWFIGDTTSDLETGRRAGLHTMLVRTGYAGRDGKFPILPDYTAPNLSSAIRWILNGHPNTRAKLLPFVANHMQARLILIGGLSRSGKSSAAQVLKEQFAAANRQAHVIALDSWLFPPADRQEGHGVLSRYDLQAAVCQIREWHTVAARRFLRIPSYDPLTRTASIPALIRSVGPDDVIIVEGVPALAVEELVSLADARIYIETDETDRRARLLADYQWRGHSHQEIEALIESRAQDETELVVESRSRADFTLHNQGLL
jgi:histidinol-phosphate phosphatase family protein